MTDARRARLLAWAICLFGGLATGLSAFSQDSNHPTYLPPALHYLDPGYLAHDWWLSSALQYHFAFFALAAVLSRLGVLELGLALLNVITVAGGLYACFRMMVQWRTPAALAALGLLVAMLLATRSFFTVGNSYLFTASLQPSTVAAAATLWAMVEFQQQRLGRCGLWLALAGLFHVNFLLVNIAFFGLAQGLATITNGSFRALLERRFPVAIMKLLGPSLVLLAAFAPLILSVAKDRLGPAQAAWADWIFFRFAVPNHYYPLVSLVQQVNFATWQALGLMWTAKALPDPAQRRLAWVMQGAFVAIIWSATALTTLVFIPEMSRLYLWRLAPFAVILAAMLVIVGGLCHLLGKDAPDTARKDKILLWCSLVALLYLARPVGYLTDQWLFTLGIQPVFFILAALLGAIALRRRIDWAAPDMRIAAAVAVLAAMGFGVATQPGDGLQQRYSLVLPASAAERDRLALFAFVRTSTPVDAQFAVPPDLAEFRLLARRPIIVDFKALPMDRTSLIEWYRRLEAISGVGNPQNVAAVELGYSRMDAARLELLRQRYGIDFAVLPAENPVSSPLWSQVYRNHSFKVMARRTGL